MRKDVQAIFSRWTTPLGRVALAGILVGATIGGLTSLSRGGVSEATALVRVYTPLDPDQIMTGIAPSPDSEQSYISGEITYLTSPGFADTVAKQLNVTSPPRLSAVQNAKSSVITLSATQADYLEAQRSVDAALKVYSDHVRQQTRERGGAAIDALNAVISGLELEATKREGQDQSVASSTGSTPTSVASPTGSTPTSNDLQARIQQLDLQRLGIQAQMGRSGVQVVQPPTKTAVTGAPTWSLGAVGGGLIGGLLGLAAALAWRKRVGVVTSPSALEGLIEHSLLPTVRLGALSESSEAYAGLARSLYAQLPAPRSGRILLIGASADSGTEDVARLIAFAAAEHARVSVVHLLDGVQAFNGFESSAVLTDGATIVIDGGSVDTSPALPEVAEDASQIIVVAMIGRDVNDTVRMACQLARNSDIPISAVCTRRAIRTTRPIRRNNMHPKLAARTSPTPAGPFADLIADGGAVPQGSRHGIRTDAETPQQLDHAENLFSRHGGKVVTAASFTEGLRRINSLLGGIAGMHTAVGAVLWAGILAGLGYLGGEKIVELNPAFERYEWYIIGALVAIAAIAITRGVRRRRSDTAA